jgi:hypothetical protein
MQSGLNLIQVPREMRNQILAYLHHEVTFDWKWRASGRRRFTFNVTIPRAPLLSLSLVCSRINIEYQESATLDHHMVIRWDGRTRKPSEGKAITISNSFDGAFKYAKTITMLMHESREGLPWRDIEKFFNLLQLHCPHLDSITIVSNSDGWETGHLRQEYLPSCTSITHPGRKDRAKVPDLLGGMFLKQYAHVLRVKTCSERLYGLAYFVSDASDPAAFLRYRVEIVAAHCYAKGNRTVRYASIDDVVVLCPHNDFSSAELARLSDHDKQTLAEHGGKTWGWEDWRGEDIRSASGSVHIERKEVPEEMNPHENEGFATWFD